MSSAGQICWTCLLVQFFLENLRCIISGPGEWGKNCLLKNLVVSNTHIKKLYNIGTTGDQYGDIGIIIDEANVEFIKDIEDLNSPDEITKDLKKIIIIDDVKAKEPVINECFCRSRQKNCDMVYHNQILFSSDRQNVRENCNISILFEQNFNQYIETSLNNEFLYIEWTSLWIQL